VDRTIILKSGFVKVKVLRATGGPNPFSEGQKKQGFCAAVIIIAFAGGLPIMIVDNLHICRPERRPHPGRRR
jgi:hypothetical protein